MPKGHKTDPAVVSEVVKMRMEGMTVDAIARQTGAARSLVTRYSGWLADNASGKVRIARALSDLNGSAASVDEVLNKVMVNDPGANNIDIHNAVHLLWSLNKGGLVTFRELGGRPVDIKLTRRGWDYVGLTRKTHVGDKDHRGEVPRKTEDKTDFRTQPSTTSGGPVVHIPSTASSTVVPTEPERYEAPVTDQGAEGSSVAHAMVGMVRSAIGPALIVPGPGDTFLTLPEGFPLIATLRRRRAALELAAKTLEVSGLEDVALEVLAHVDELTPLEREVVRLLDEWHVDEPRVTS